MTGRAEGQLQEPTPFEAIQALRALVGRIRPPGGTNGRLAEARLRVEAGRLAEVPEEAAHLARCCTLLLAMPGQGPLYAESGVRSSLGAMLELTHRVRERVLPQPPDDRDLASVLQRIFREPHDPDWVGAVSEDAWIALGEVLGPDLALPQANLLRAVQMVSYRIAGTVLDRELLRAAPFLESRDSPFLAQNALLVPCLAREAAGGEGLRPEEARQAIAHFARCREELARIRTEALERGVTLRLTYQLSRLDQLLDRLELLLDLLAADGPEERRVHAVRLLRTLVEGERARRGILAFLRDDVGILARNITGHASRQGEHYVAESRSEWRAMLGSACGGGVVIAFMAALKLRLALLHLPPLTEGLVFGLNYGLGFVLIYLLGFTVATKQPAMTAASIAATLEEHHPEETHRLVDFAQNVVRTQVVAVLGNVGVVFPVAWLVAWTWLRVAGVPEVPREKALHLLQDASLLSGALVFAAVAGVGLFLSGLVSGYFDNRARYLGLREAAAASPVLAWLGPRRAARVGRYLDAHSGAILGNLAFGLYLGFMGAMRPLTGLPLDIRHVTFSAANVGVALTALPAQDLVGRLPWAIAGVLGIATVNLAVSFVLALWVAIRSRGLDASPALHLGRLLLQRFRTRPLGFLAPPGP